MFFLIRVAFWLTLVLALLPSGGSSTKSAPSPVDAGDAISAAGAAVADVSGFCDRQPDACTVGAQAAVVIGQRAQAGARMVYDFISEHALRGGETGSVTGKVAAARTVPPSPGSQSTLKPGDLDADWQGPPSRTGSVPLPPPRPRKDAPRKA